MRILLDECLPKKLKPALSGHTVVTVTEAGWSGIKNGALLRLAEGNFDAFITVDRGLQYQQNLSDITLAIVLLVARNNTLATLRPLMPKVQEALHHAQPGTVFRVGAVEPRL